jgi:hypothetical protein
MTEENGIPTVVTASRVVAAPARTVFELIADPARQPLWDRGVRGGEPDRLAAFGTRPSGVGHLWRWELERLDDAHVRVTHTCDWSRLTDAKRVKRARVTTSEKLLGSVVRLAELAEAENAPPPSDG